MGIDYFDPGGPEPQNGGGVKKSKFSDFTQNDFLDVSDDFPKKNFAGKYFALRTFFQKKSPKNASEIDFLVTSQNDTCVDGISMVAIFSRSDQKRPMAAILVPKNV